MKRIAGFLVLTVAVLGLVSPGFAAERDYREQTAQGGVFRDNDAAAGGTLISGANGLMTGVAFTTGGTAAVIALYDSASVNDLTAAKCRYEDGVAANTGKFVNLQESPIRFKNGIVLVTNRSENGVVVYTEQAN